MNYIGSLTGSEFEEYTKQNFTKVYSMFIAKGLTVKDNSATVPGPFGTSTDGEFGIAVYVPGEYFRHVEYGDVYVFKGDSFDGIDTGVITHKKLSTDKLIQLFSKI